MQRYGGCVLPSLSLCVALRRPSGSASQFLWTSSASCNRCGSKSRSSSPPYFRRDAAGCNMAAMSTLLSLVAPLCLLQAVEYRSPAGVVYRSQRDTGAIAPAESALAAASPNVDPSTALRVAQSAVPQSADALATFTRGLGF